MHEPSPSAASDCPQIPRETISIVICTRFRPVALCSCLAAISKLRRLPDEVLIVENSTGDRRTKDLAEEFSAGYIVEPAIGLSRARNRGLDSCTSEIVAYLDDDAVPDENWLNLLSEPFSDPRVAVVTGEVVTSENSPYGRISGERRFLDKNAQSWFEVAAFGGLGIGTNMSLRKSECRLSEMSDERLGRGAPYYGMEEHDAFTQLLSQGYCAVHIPAAVVHHTSQNQLDLKKEARSLFAYSMLLYSEFPSNRGDLLRFLFRRMRHRPLTWAGNSPDPGDVVKSNWWVLLKASLSGAVLYLQTRKKRK